MHVLFCLIHVQNSFSVAQVDNLTDNEIPGVAESLNDKCQMFFCKIVYHAYQYHLINFWKWLSFL